MPEDRTEDEKQFHDFHDWLSKGIRKGYCSELFCANHDQWQHTDAERAEIEADNLDVCCHVVRIWGYKGKDGA